MNFRQLEIQNFISCCSLLLSQSLPSQKVRLLEESDFVFHFSNYEIHETAAYSGRHGRERRRAGSGGRITNVFPREGDGGIRN